MTILLLSLILAKAKDQDTGGCELKRLFRYFKQGMQMKLIFAIIILFHASGALASGGDECLGDRNYSDVTFNVMKKRTFGFLAGYDTSHRPFHEDLAWSFGKPSVGRDKAYEYISGEFIDFISKLKPLNYWREESGTPCMLATRRIKKTAFYPLAWT